MAERWWEGDLPIQQSLLWTLTFTLNEVEPQSILRREGCDQIYVFKSSL